ncbi:MAG TPA: type VI secretion system baseplate subunit TssK [Planctomycetes bacterium]|nr:type VI secretion system baseplate subunit TssK [Planctomycetota bacterium]
MDHVQRVLWHEGMFITPNHFQQADRHAESVLHRALRAVQPTLRGLTDLEVDRDALGTGSFALRSCAGVMPDGTVFAMPEADELPPSRPFEQAFTSDRDRLGILLCLPDRRPGLASSDDPSRPSPTPVRYKRRGVRVRDEVHGGSEREIPVGVCSFSLRFDGEAVEGQVSLRIAELVRSPSGGFAVSEDFAPTALCWGATPPVGRLLKRMVDICCAKAGDLAAQRRQRTQGMVEFSVSESANYLLLHTLNGAIPGLMHLAASPRAHPELVWRELARLCGALHTFAADGHPREVSPYRHDDLTATFAGLDARLRALLDTNITARYVPIALARGGNGVWTGRVPESVLDAHRFYLSVQSSAAAEKVSLQTPAKAKVASAGKVPLLVAQALKGLGLTYLSVPPGEIPAQPGCSYFEVQRSGDEWQSIVDARSIGVYLPPDFTDLKMEFMAVKE